MDRQSIPFLNKTCTFFALVGALVAPPLQAQPARVGNSVRAATVDYANNLERYRVASSSRKTVIKYDKDTGIPRFISGEFRTGRSDSPMQAARKLLGVLSGIPTGAALSQRYVLEDELNDAQGYTHLRFQQVVSGIPIEGAEVMVHVAPDGNVTSINGHIIPGKIAVQRATLSEDEAETLARAALEKQAADPTTTDLPNYAKSLEIRSPATQVVLAGRSEVVSGQQSLAWRVQLGQWTVYVQANSGEILKQHLAGDLVPVDTYTANGSSYIPGTLMASNDPEYRSSSIDNEESEAHDYATEYGSYIEEAFGRDSIDDFGLRLEQTLQYEDMANAYWDAYQAVFGPGWATRDIVGHEFTHGLTEYTANLVYENEAGALNESFSDILAVMIDRDDWQQGEEADGYSTDNPVRDLADPHKGDRFHPEQSYNRSTNSGQPAHYSEFLTSGDEICGSTGDAYNGCVHFNSGIQNHAAFLMAVGGSTQGVIVSGVGRSDTEQVFYRNLATRLTSYDGFIDARDNMLEACSELYGEGSQTCISAQNAWAAVGVGVAWFETYIVATDGSGDFTSIQNAVDAASDGDHIVIRAGTYAGSFSFGGKTLIIEGEDRAQVILEGDGSGPVVVVAGGEQSGTSLAEVTIQGGVGVMGGGLTCTGGSLALYHVILSSNFSDYGAGIGAEDCTLSIDSVEIRDNKAALDGGGIYTVGGSLSAEALTAERNLASGNGGGLYLLGTASISEAQISENAAFGDGAGLYIASNLTMIDTRLDANSAGQSGGGIAANATASGTLSALLVGENVAAVGGGMALLEASSALTMRNLIVSSNMADLGGGVAAGASTVATLRNVTLVDNIAPAGAAVYAFENSTLSVDSAILAFQDGNSIDSDGTGAVSVSYSDVFQASGTTIGTGNINADPQFVGFINDGNAFNDDLHLLSGSPAVNTGNPSSQWNDANGTRNDMGAYGGPNIADWPGEYVPCYANAVEINFGATISGALSTSDPTGGPRGGDFYFDALYLYVEAGTTLDISMEAGFDTYLYLLSATCSTLDSDDDGGNGTNSLLTYSVSTSGIYTIIATSYGSYATGAYTLRTY